MRCSGLQNLRVRSGTGLTDAGYNVNRPSSLARGSVPALRELIFAHKYQSGKAAEGFWPKGITVDADGWSDVAVQLTKRRALHRRLTW
jgi:hypothetical protein